jgi:hypothetical protein
MTTTHAAVTWFAGDDWQINATLLDENGNAYNLGQPNTIKWCLIDAAYNYALDEGDVSITITDAAAGQCMILVPAAKTSPLPGGRYSDAIRIVIGGVTSTLSVGPIYVSADPWAQESEAASAAAKPHQMRPRLRLASG